MGWAHDVELLYRAQRHGMRLHAMPLTWTAVDGSKIRLIRDATNMLIEVFAISRRVRREKLNKQLLSVVAQSEERTGDLHKEVVPAP
jgi:hypothetical protein